MFTWVTPADAPPFLEYLFPSHRKEAVAFYKATVPILSKMTESNRENMRDLTLAIHVFVKKLAKEKAKEITYLLIRLPLRTIKMYLVNYDLFVTSVSKAKILLQRREQN